MYYNLVLSGGAIQGLTFIGAIKYFEEAKISKNLHNILGSSSGSIIALALAVNYTSEELCEFIKQYFIVSKNSINNITTRCVLTFLRDFGLDDGKNVIRIVETLLENKNVNKDITFSDISKQFGKNLIISASNLTTGKIEYFDVNNSYTMMVKHAIRYSVSIPFLFKPCKHKNCLYVDSLIYNYFPIDYFSDEMRKTTIGVKIISEMGELKCNNIITFGAAIVSSMIQKLGFNKKDEYDIIEIYTDLVYNFNYRTMNFEIDQQILNKYVDIGYESAKKKNLKTS